VTAIVVASTHHEQINHHGAYFVYLAHAWTNENKTPLRAFTGTLPSDGAAAPEEPADTRSRLPRVAWRVNDKTRVWAMTNPADVPPARRLTPAGARHDPGASEETKIAFPLSADLIWAHYTRSLEVYLRETLNQTLLMGMPTPRR